MDNIISVFRKKTGTWLFEDTVGPHMDQLYRQACHLTGHRQDAEDLLQDLLVALYPRAEKISGMDNPGSWLSRCLYNRFVDNYRKHRRRPQHIDIDESRDASELASRCTAESQLAYRELYAAMEVLSRAQRAVIVLHDIEGHTLVELANTLDQPLGTLKSHLHRGRKALKSQLEMQPFLARERVNVRESKQ